MDENDSAVYEGHAHTSVYPSYFATVAHFMGHDPAPIPNARFLELGCSTGANLIPLAVDNPGARCVGLDLAKESIARGNRIIESLGLSNIELQAKDLTKIDGSLGEFDFIVAHGLYSWVPPEVQDMIWRICSENLSPNGVAYISYNVFPGWHFKLCTRDMLRFMSRNEKDPAGKIQQSRKFMEFMEKISVGYQNHFGTYVREAANYVKKVEDYHLLGEYLGPYNSPVYFHQFMEEAESRGLGYIWDSNINRSFIDNFPPEVSSALQAMSSDLIGLEQAIDFMQNREMRRSLLCRAENTPDRQIDPSRLKSYYMLSFLAPVDGAIDPLQNTTMHLRDPAGLDISIDNPLTKAALLEMPESWPVALSFPEILERAIARIGWAGEQAPQSKDIAWWEDSLANDLARLYLAGCLKCRRDPVNVVGMVSERPVASPFARAQASQQNRVANQHHRSTALDAMERQILGLMDGTRTLAELALAMPQASHKQLEIALHKIVTSALLVA